MSTPAEHAATVRERLRDGSVWLDKALAALDALEADLQFARVDIERLNAKLQDCAQAEEDAEGKLGHALLAQQATMDVAVWLYSLNDPSANEHWPAMRDKLNYAMEVMLTLGGPVGDAPFPTTVEITGKAPWDDG